MVVTGDCRSITPCVPARRRPHEAFLRGPYYDIFIFFSSWYEYDVSQQIICAFWYITNHERLDATSSSKAIKMNFDENFREITSKRATCDALFY